MDATIAQGTATPVLDQDLVAGQRVGEYVVEGKLGEGGFGSVFRASHPVIGKLVAIKVLHHQYSMQRDMVSRFVEEARAVNQIRHRGIIDIFGFGQLDDGRQYYVMELLDGLTLADHLATRGRLPLGEALPILRAVGRALDAAHAKGIAHRDLKPENIYLAYEPDGGFFPKLLDFGIAKLLVADGATSHKTRTGAPIGTPLYMSPEQCRGRDVDHRTDIYAFGIVAFRMLTGAMPFDGDDYMTILMLQMSEPPPAASTRVPDLPPEIDQILCWTLAKDPAERPQSLTHAVEALERVAATALGIVSPAWSATPPTGALPAYARTPAGLGGPLGRSSSMASGLPVGQVGTSPGFAAASAPGRARWPWMLGVAALAAVGVTALVLRGGAATTAPPPTEFVEAQATAGSAATPGSAPGPTTTATTPTTTATTPTTTTEAPPVPAPPPSAEVRLRFEGLPDNAVVYDAEHRALGLAKQGIEVARSSDELLLSFEAAGRVLASARVTPSEDQLVRPKLHARPRPPRPPRAGATGAKTPVDPNSTERPAGL
ncbi:MAG: serine/threonine-protein kinase [Kofleriaceae bacterium]